MFKITNCLYLCELPLAADVRQSALDLSHVGDLQGFPEREVPVPQHPPSGKSITEIIKLVVTLANTRKYLAVLIKVVAYNLILIVINFII